MSDAPVNAALEIRYILVVLAHRLAFRVAQLCDWLAVAFCHLHDDIKRRRASVVCEVGANSEGDLDPAFEVLLDLGGPLEVQTVTEQQRLRRRVNSKLLVVRDHSVAPCEGVARVMPYAVEQSGESVIKVEQETRRRDGVTEPCAVLDAEAVDPGFHRVLVRVRRVMAWSRLSDALDVFVRDRSDCLAAVLFREVHVRRADEPGHFLLDTVLDQPVLHVAAQATAKPELGEVSDVIFARRQLVELLDCALLELDVLAVLAVRERIPDLRDKLEDGYFVHRSVQPSATGFDREIAAFVRTDVPLVDVDLGALWRPVDEVVEIAFAQPREVGVEPLDLVPRKPQRAVMVDPLSQFGDHLWRELDVLVPALERPCRSVVIELPTDNVVHVELILVSLQQAVDYWLQLHSL